MDFIWKWLKLKGKERKFEKWQNVAELNEMKIFKKKRKTIYKLKELGFKDRILIEICCIFKFQIIGIKNNDFTKYFHICKYWSHI